MITFNIPNISTYFDNVLAKRKSKNIRKYAICMIFVYK